MNILVTGKNGNISTAFCDYMHKRYPDYNVETISIRGSEWKTYDYSKVDCIYHCAGVYKADNYDTYKNINVELAKELFNLAQEAGVKQFIYMSTMDVYDYSHTDSSSSGYITAKTKPNPQSYYGRSKLEAEEALINSVIKDTKLAIIRSCPVVGSNAETALEGYRKAVKLPAFPIAFCDNKRSILYIDTLCELIKKIIDQNGEGFFYPQNLPLLSVFEIVGIICSTSNKKIKMIRLPKLLWLKNKTTNKIFGSVCYSQEMSNHYSFEYSTITSIEAIQKTIRR